MERRDTDDLLSGFFDGELTADERAKAESLLQSSATARAELSSIAELSAVLRSVRDDVAIPPALAEETERQLAKLRQQAPALVHPPKTFWRREIVAGFSGGLVTIAAALLVMVSWQPSAGVVNEQFALQQHPDGQGQSVFEIASNHQPLVRKPESPTVSRMMASRSVVPSTAPAPVTVAAPQTNLAEAAASPKSPVNQSTGRPMAAAVGQLALNNSVQIGDVVPYFSQGPNDVALMEVMTVLDVEPAANRLQVLLAKNSITSWDATDSTSTVEKEGVSPAIPKKSQAGLVMVYVDAPGDRLAAALQDFEAESHVVRLRLKPPITLPEEAIDKNPEGVMAQSQALQSWLTTAVEQQQQQGVSEQESPELLGAAPLPSIEIGSTIRGGDPAVSGGGDFSVSGAEGAGVASPENFFQRGSFSQRIDVASRGESRTFPAPKQSSLETNFSSSSNTRVLQNGLYAATGNSLTSPRVRLLFLLQQTTRNPSELPRPATNAPVVP